MATDDQSLFALLKETEFQILKLEKSEIVKPYGAWTRQVDEHERISALKVTELKKGKHFEFKPISNFHDCKNDILKDFLGSKIKGTEGNIRHDIIKEVFRCNWEMMESLKVSASSYMGELQ